MLKCMNKFKTFFLVPTLLFPGFVQLNENYIFVMSCTEFAFEQSTQQPQNADKPIYFYLVWSLKYANSLNSERFYGHLLLSTDETSV